MEDREMIELDYKKIEYVELDNIRTDDYPDFVDAYIMYAIYDGRDMTQDELDILNDDRDYVHQKVWERLY